MNIFSIKLQKEKPYTQKAGNVFISAYWSEPEQGYWIVYADTFLSESEVYEILTDENIEKYCHGR